MLAVILNQHLIKKERAGRMQKPRIPPHPTTKQEILFLRRMGFPAQKKMNQMVIGATLQGKPAWFTIENKYDSPGKWELTTSEDDRRPVVYNQDQLKVLIKTLEKIVENM